MSTAGSNSGRIDRLRDLLEGPGGKNLKENVRTELQHIQTQLKKIEHRLANMTIADTARYRGYALRVPSTLSSCLWKVDAVGSEIDSILDDMDEWEAKEILKGHHRRRRQIVPPFVSSFVKLRPGRQRRRPNDVISSEITEIADLLESVLGISLPDPGPIPALDKLALHTVGRKDEISCLSERIRAMSGERSGEVKVLSIVGAAGMGKSTLAALVCDGLWKKPYNREQMFDHTTWAEMSGSFDHQWIVEQIPHDRWKQCSIEEYFSGKTFLLVMDDVDRVEPSKWTSFKTRVLDRGGPGSIIVVTTRSEKVAAKIFYSDHTHRIAPMSDVDIRSMLTYGRADNLPKSKKNLVKKLAKKCLGSPISARYYEDQMTSVRPSDWKYLLNTNADSMYQSLENMVRRLDVSYNKLSPPLKRCISFCAAFPRDSVINVDRLIRLWMAKGYLHRTSEEEEEDDDKSREARGTRYFHVLVDHCFFKKLIRSSIHTNKITSCVMDQYFHEFAKNMAENGKGWLDKHGFKPRVSSTYNRCPIYTKSHKLQTCWIHVRAMVLSSSDLEEFPPELGHLTLLQYLDLSHNPVKKLPETMCNLHSLVFLDVSFCYMLLRLPQNTASLETLQHLRVNHTTDELHRLPKDFHKLSLLRSLDVFRVGGEKYSDNFKALKHLDHLQDIRIAIHGEVQFKDAKMGEKAEMENLELCFVGEGRDREKATSMMREFRPPPNLQMLKLKDYPGMRLPNWIQAKSLVNKLTRLSLTSASNITSLPALWKLSSLEFLWLHDIPNLERLGGEFFGLQNVRHQEKQQHDLSDDEDISDYSADEGDDNDLKVEDLATAFLGLKTLRIEYMQSLEIWDDANEEDDDRRVKVMPSLEKLLIADCPKLKPHTLPRRILGRISSLKIKIDGCRIHNINDYIADDKPGTSKGKETQIEPEQS